MSHTLNVRVQTTAIGWVRVKTDDYPGMFDEQIAEEVLNAVREGDTVPDWDYASAEVIETNTDPGWLLT